jgi:exopolysaccharide biosynthesis polyprenyl glycosylphosphotransferase
MSKNRINFLFTILKITNDIFAIALSFIIAYEMKFRWLIHISDVKAYPDVYIDMYLKVMWLIVFIWIFSFIISGLYKQYGGPLKGMNELTAIGKGAIFATILTFTFTYAYQGLPQSRYVIAYSLPVAFIILAISHWFINKIKKFVLSHNIGNKKAVIIGVNSMGQEIAEKMLLYPDLGFNYIGSISNITPDKLRYHLKKHFVHLGTIREFKRVIVSTGAEALFIAVDDIDQRMLNDIILFCKDNDIFLRFTPTRYQFKTGSTDFDDMDGIPLIGVTYISFSKYRCFIKRLFDLILVIPLIIITSPVMLILALLVKFSSKGPVLYKQIRVTMHGREFWFIKFRSMYTDAEEETGPTYSTSDQKDRTTKIGNFIRKSSLDELPQFFNVLKGDMSLVGPRPERPFFHDKFSKEIQNWDDRLLVRGGMTGWAQINGRAELTTEPLEKLAYDLYYIENWSLMFDLKIMLRTVTDVIQHKNVY